MRQPAIVLRPGRIRRDQDHLIAMIRDGGREIELALLTPASAALPESGSFRIQWLIYPDHWDECRWAKALREWLDEFLINKGEPRPWADLCKQAIDASSIDAAESGGVYWVRSFKDAP